MQCLRAQFTTTWRFALRKTHLTSPQLVGKRNILTASTLKIDKFMKSKIETVNQTTDAESFKEDIKNNLNTHSDYLVFSGDLKKYIRLAETDDDMLVLEPILARFYSQYDNLRFQQFDFGPEVMRLYYIKNRPVEAMSYLKKDEFSKMFTSFSSFLVLMDLLFNNKMYNEVIEVFQIFRSKLGVSRRMPSPFTVLYFGACYKLNTPEIYKEALVFWNELGTTFYVCPYRAKWFLALLALLQKEYFPVVEILLNSTGCASRNMRAIALAKSGRYNDALQELRAFGSSDQPKYLESFICMETLEILEKEFAKSNDDQIRIFNELKNGFVTLNNVSQMTLDELVCKPLDHKPAIKSHGNNRRQNRI